MVRRMGAAKFEIRHTEEEPAAWVALASWDRPGGVYWDCAAAMAPTRAVMRLCELLVDGGQCKHCERPTVFEPEASTDPLMPSLMCAYQWDPELATFRRSCEGEAP